MAIETTTACLAGATGWAGSEFARAIASASDLRLVAAVSRTHAGRRLGDVLDDARLACPVFASAMEALAHQGDVFVEHTKHDTVKSQGAAALEHGAHVVVGTSGLSDDDYATIDEAARAPLARGAGRRQLRLDRCPAAEVRGDQGR